MDELQKITGLDKDRKEWFFVRGDEVFGPVDFFEVEGLIREGHIKSEDLIWSKGKQDWLEPTEFSGSIDDIEKRKKVSEIETDPTESKILNPKHNSQAVSLSLLGIFLAGVIVLSGSFYANGKYAAKNSSDLRVESEQTVKVCNQSAHDVIHIALGSEHSAAEKWMANGWFPVNRGECYVTSDKLRLPVYGFAKNSEGQAIKTDAIASKDFCVHENQKFMFYDSICKQSNDSQFQFLPFYKLGFFPELGEVHWLIK